MQSQQDWWRGAVIYQIYPRSFYDSNGDGIGDLPGITAKLDYIASLNVDAIWISPFFTSPMKDFGYDVADYRGVDPIFGTLEDFDALVRQAHDRGLKVIIDQVLSHTSDQHPWFIESRSSRDNPKADWYVWAEAKPDGTPPNNWLSVFGGSAWQWDSRRRQYYLHNFLSSQPDLNYHNPAVVNQMLEEVEFWLKRGVDGFRLDAVNFCVHDAALRDNPANEAVVDSSIGVRRENPYAYQRHVYDKTRPENLVFLEKLRALMDRYPGTTTVGEIGDDDSLTTMAAYTEGNKRLHMAYSFDFLTEKCSRDFIARTVAAIEEKLSAGWPCLAIGNHDVARVATRWGDGDYDARRVTAHLALLLTLKGSVCLYQGEELGLPEAELAYEDLVDPYGIAFWPEYKGRDGCRTPMPWDAGKPNLGFTTGAPWLPAISAHQPFTVATEETQPDSTLQHTRQLLAWRRAHPVLQRGAIQLLDAPENVLLYRRTLDDQRVVIAVNLSGQEVKVPNPGGVKPAALARQPDFLQTDWSGQGIALQPWGVAVGIED
ncbi:MAG: DUF3459 domain-containing protein [Gammaproteobacteria bacterium]|nr:MAG: DUF3459 domain-containing protein [Gammaproteobacteria bacterium]